MRLNADIIYHDLKARMDVSIHGVCGNELSLYRPEFYIDRTTGFKKDHVYVCSADHLPEDPLIEENVLLICIGDAPQLAHFEEKCGILSVPGGENIFRVFNIIQEIYNKYETWEADLHSILKSSASLQELLDTSRDIFNNPMLLIGADFNYLAYTEKEYLQERLSIRFDSPTFDPDLLEVFMSLHEIATDIKDPLLLDLMGRSTLSVNIFDADEYLGCITVFGEFRGFHASDVPICQFLADMIKQAFQLKPNLAGDRTALRSAILNIISELPVDQEQRGIISRYNKREDLICAVFRPSADVTPLPVGYVCSMIEQKFKGALAFEHKGLITAVLPADPDGVRQLPDLLKRTRTACGVSHSFTDLYESGYAYYQAVSALETKGISTADGISLFEDAILPLLLNNSKGGIPARYYFTEGLARLAKHDASSQVSYIDTLKAFLDNNSSVAETARELHLHRSSLIDRIERIKQMIGSDLTDPGERLKLQMILYANAGEE